MSSGLDELVTDIRAIHRSDPLHASQLIESYLHDRFETEDPVHQLELLDRLQARFASKPPEPDAPVTDSCQLGELVSLLFGIQLDDSKASTESVLRQLAELLNRIFDSVNEIVGVIQGTLLGERGELQTIRRLIRSDLKENRTTGAIEQYLNQIKQSFLLANRAFKMAAHSEVRKILNELDPAREPHEAEHGLKFGFFKKSEQLEDYRARYERVRKWFEADRFLEELTREFEKTCQKLYAEKGEESEGGQFS